LNFLQKIHGKKNKLAIICQHKDNADYIEMILLYVRVRFELADSGKTEDTFHRSPSFLYYILNNYIVLRIGGVLLEK
jgi:hypothetical protein